jgi:hypothetical protein
MEHVDKISIDIIIFDALRYYIFWMPHRRTMNVLANNDKHNAKLG